MQIIPTLQWFSCTIVIMSAWRFEIHSHPNSWFKHRNVSQIVSIPLSLRLPSLTCTRLLSGTWTCQSFSCLITLNLHVSSAWSAFSSKSLTCMVPLSLSSNFTSSGRPHTCVYMTTLCQITLCIPFVPLNTTEIIWLFACLIIN